MRELPLSRERALTMLLEADSTDEYWKEWRSFCVCVLLYETLNLDWWPFVATPYGYRWSSEGISTTGFTIRYIITALDWCRRSEANNTTAFLRRNLSSRPQHIKDTCYMAFVRPQLEYTAAVWDPYTNNNTANLEGVWSWLGVGNWECFCVFLKSCRMLTSS